MEMKTSDIARVLKRDLLRVDDRAAVDIARCFSCGCSMTYRGSRFCGDRCREAFDNGGRPFSPSRIVYCDRAGDEMKATTTGFRIRCGCCEKEFDSKGLRCCSVECERGYRERQENLAAMAEVGIQPTAKRRCEQCGGTIPKWRGGRQVSRVTRFCSRRCREAQKRRETLKKSA